MAKAAQASLLSRIRDAWRESPECRVSFAFVDFLSGHIKETKHLSIGFFRDLAKAEHVDDADVAIRVVQYFVDTHIIELHFEFLDDEDNAYPVELSAVTRARATGQLIHPATGEFESDFETRLFVYFVPSAEALKIFSEESNS
jgi:hypothetical protein